MVLAGCLQGLRLADLPADLLTMIRRFSPWALAAGLMLALAGCATFSFETTPSWSNDPALMGRDEVSLDRFLTWAETRNPDFGRSRWAEVWQAYRDACRTEGVSQSAALVQMVHETGWMKFGGTVQARQNNFAGLGTVDKNTPGLSFPDIRTGALAHVQHLKAYASTAPLVSTLVDPRFRYVKRGSAPTLLSLTGKWAADPEYGIKLVKLYQALWGWS